MHGTLSFVQFHVFHSSFHCSETMLSDLFSVETGLWTRISLHLVSFLFFLAEANNLGKPFRTGGRGEVAECGLVFTVCQQEMV